MSRKKRNCYSKSICLKSDCPWWTGFVVAPFAYFLMHAMANIHSAPVSGVNDFDTNALSQVFHVIGQYGQFVIPLACVLWALLSACQKWAHNNFHAAMIGNIFKELPKSLFRKKHQTPEKEQSLADPVKVNVPICPDCGSVMEACSERKADITEAQLWVCSQFPVCCATKPFDKSSNS